MTAYPEYKATGLQWLPQIPKHWELRRAKHLYKKANRPVTESDDVVTCFRDGVVTLRKKRRTRGFTESLKEIGYQGIRKGDLVIHVMDAFAGAIGVSDSDGKGTPVYNVCIPKLDINNYYYAYIVREMARRGYIQSLYRGIRERSSDFRFEVFAAQVLPYPPSDEQAQIVRYLDAMTAKINKLIRAKKKQIALLQEQKQAIINQAVTQGLDPNVEMKDSGIDWLGKIPEGWNISPLKRALAAPMVDGPHETPEFVAEGIPFVSADASHDGRIHLSECRGYISSDIHRKYCQKVKPRRNDIFIVKSGSTTGKTVLVDFDDEFSIWSPLALVRCRHNVNYKFVFYALSSSYFQKEVQDNWSYGTQPNIGMGVLKSLLIALPTPKNQAIIADFLDDISASIDKTREKCQSEIFFLHEYKNSLISAVVTGKIDVRGLAAEDVLPEDMTIDDEEASEDVEEEMTEAESEGDAL